MIFSFFFLSFISRRGRERGGGLNMVWNLRFVSFPLATRLITYIQKGERGDL